MVSLHPLILAGLTGFISGLLLAIPVGPVNLSIINEGARRGFGWAVLIGLGATVMEITYCAIAFTSFAGFFTQGMVKKGMELFSFAFLLYLGLRFLFASSFPRTGKIGKRVEERLHPHTAFMTGFVQTLCNLGVFVFWVILAANFISRGWVRPELLDKMVCVGGVALGCGLWFLILCWAVSLGHRKFSERTLLRMERVSGVILLIFAVVHGINILVQMGGSSG